MRKAESKAKGIKPKRKPHVVEEHYDDLGDDLTGLKTDVQFLAADVTHPEWSDDSDSGAEDLI